MATLSMGDIKKGKRLEIDGNPFKVIEFQHVKPGKGAAFVRMKIKNLATGKFALQGSASAFSVSKADVDKVCKYILNQA